MTVQRQVVFVTGGSGFLGRRLVRALAARLDPACDRVVLLALTGTVPTHQALLDELPVSGAVVEGDLARMHLGLSAAEYRELGSTVTSIWHLAALQDLAAPAAQLRAVNVEGTREVLELACASPRRPRVHHLSTAFVSGDRQGLVQEEELERGQGFFDLFARTRYEAERLARRAMADLPVTVYRPSIVVGDPTLGERARLDEPHALALLLATSPVPLPFPGDGQAPLHLVPAEFVVEAALAVAARPDSAGRTVHLVDPSPLTVGRLYELVAEREGKAPPPMTVPWRPLEALLGLPIVERLLRPQRTALRLVNHHALYGCGTLLTLLEGAGVRCPTVTDYLDRLVAFARQGVVPGRLEPSPAVDDPLDSGPAAAPASA